MTGVSCYTLLLYGCQECTVPTEPQFLISLNYLPYEAVRKVKPLTCGIDHIQSRKENWSLVCAILTRTVKGGESPRTATVLRQDEPGATRAQRKHGQRISEMKLHKLQEDEKRTPGRMALVQLRRKLGLQHWFLETNGIKISTAIVLTN